MNKVKASGGISKKAPISRDFGYHQKKHYYDDISHPDIYSKYILGCGFTNNPCESQTGLKFKTS